MSAFISEGHIYLYDRNTDQFQIIPFEGIIISAYFSGDESICIIDSNRNLWCRGSNYINIVESSDVSHEFTIVPLNFGVQKVITTGHTTVILDDAGNIWVAGKLGDFDSPNEFTQLIYGIPFINFSCGNDNILAIDIYGNLWGYGYNRDYPLGVSDIMLTELTLIKDNVNFVTVDCTDEGSICVDSMGNVWGCGKNLYDILGWDVNDQPWEFRLIAQGMKIVDALIRRNKILLLSEEGKVYRYGYSLSQNEFEFIPRNQQTRSFEEVLQGILVTHMDIFQTKTMVKDQEDNLWILGYYRNKIFPFQKLPGIKADTLVNQRRNNNMEMRRFNTTKRSLY